MKSLLHFIFTCALLLQVSGLQAAPGDISTVAGGHIPLADGTTQLSSIDFYAEDVTTDAQGNLYFSDSVYHSVYKVNTTGFVTRIAGTGVPGSELDQLDKPQGIAMDAEGNLYIIDAGNNRLLKRSPNGGITQLPVNGFYYDHFSNGIAIDNSGNLLVSVYGKVMKVDTSTGTTSTIAGTSTTGFSGDGGPATSAELGHTYSTMATDSSGNIYILDKSNRRVRKIDNIGLITTVAGNGGTGFSGDGGLATAADIGYASQIAIDPSSDELYIYSSNRIRKVDDDGIISTVAGNGYYGNSGNGVSALNAKFGSFRGVHLTGDGAGYISQDTGSIESSIRQITTDGMVHDVAKSGGSLAPAYSGSSIRLNQPIDTAVDDAGNLFIADEQTYKITKVDVTGNASRFAGSAADETGRIYGSNDDYILATESTLAIPDGIDIDSSGNLYISDLYKIRRIDTNGIITTLAGNGTRGFSGDGGSAIVAEINRPNGLVFDGEGNAYFADRNNYRVRKINSSGTISTIAGNGTFNSSEDNQSALEASIKPWDVALDSQGNLFIADLNKGILKLSQDGLLSNVYSSTYIISIVIDSEDNIYFANSLENYINKIDTSGNITTIAGVTDPGFSGDGGPATFAILDRPRGLSLDKQNNLYFADSNNHRVRKIEQVNVSKVDIYRLYNPNTGEHLYTPSEGEYEGLAPLGWQQENIAFIAYDKAAIVDEITAKPWLRLFNPNSSLHHFTLDQAEYDLLGSLGWQQEGAVGYLFDTQVSDTHPLFRLYNPNDGNHHWTMSVAEKDSLIVAGWVDEGIAGYVHSSTGPGNGAVL